MQYIGFTMNGMEYTIPILKVQEIVNLPHLTRLPQVPAYIEGITNLRGRIIPVLNLKKLIGLGGVSSGEKVIVVTSGRIIFGVLIDAVTGVITIEDSAIDPPTDFNTSDMVSGVAKVGEKLIVLLDTKKLVPLEDMSMFEDETFEVKSEDAQSQVLREVDGSGQERPVDHIGNAINFLTRQGVDTADPGYALFDEMISFMNAIAVQDYEKADSAVKCILKKGQNELFQEVGKVTRKLDDSIRSFKEALDPRLKDMAVTEMPNAVDQLNVVIERTEAAANKTMGIVEKYILIMDELASHLRYLKEPEESVKYLKTFKTGLEDDLTEILTTQSFQDLTGQTIKKVIKLVGDVEEELVKLITTFGVKPELRAAENIVSPEKVSQEDVNELLKDFGF